jgi:hypothetical protein
MADPAPSAGLMCKRLFRAHFRKAAGDFSENRSCFAIACLSPAVHCSWFRRPDALFDGEVYVDGYSRPMVAYQRTLFFRLRASRR